MEKVSQNESKLLDAHFRDSLLIDKFHPQLDYWRRRKSEKSQSENSEDALVWNVFRTLNQINRSLWVEPLFYKAFRREFTHSADTIEIKFWKIIRPPISLQSNEEKSVIDIIIESDTFVWFIETKYKTDIVLVSEHHSKRDEILRYIDGGTNYASKRDFYFSLIILDRFNSPMGVRKAIEYKESPDKMKDLLPHRVELPSLKGISVLQWKDIQTLLKTIYLYSRDKYERYIADQAGYWLYDRIREDV